MRSGEAAVCVAQAAANCEAWQTPYLNAEAGDLEEQVREEAAAARAGGSGPELEQVGLRLPWALSSPGACSRAPPTGTGQSLLDLSYAHRIRTPWWMASASGG